MASPPPFAMASSPPRRYERDELLHLAKSPLVKRPNTLPPIEEWMGYVASPLYYPAGTLSDCLPTVRLEIREPLPHVLGPMATRLLLELRLMMELVPEGTHPTPLLMAGHFAHLHIARQMADAHPFSNPACPDLRVRFIDPEKLCFTALTPTSSRRYRPRSPENVLLLLFRTNTRQIRP